MKSIPGTEVETINTIKSLKNKKSAGYTNVSSKVIMHFGMEISKPLTNCPHKGKYCVAIAIGN